MSTNPFVYELNKFNTQNAEQINAYDELSTIDLNISTKLDVLIEELRRPPFRAVILTGDAGDGKTRFCRKIIDKYRGCVGLTRLQWKEEMDQPPATIYKDASAVPPESMQQELIGIQDKLSGGVELKRHYVVAVNEGKLRDLCQDRKLTWLWGRIENILGEPNSSGLPNLVVINLNHREIAAGRKVDDSILGKAILAVTDPKYWEERRSEQERCSICSERSHCSVWQNIQYLRNGTIRQRLWKLFIVHSYIDPGTESSHITMRGLLGSLSYIITGNLDCEAICSGTSRSLFDNMFSEDGNAVIRQLRRIDVARTSNFETDREIYSELSEVSDEDETERMRVFDLRKREYYFTEVSDQKVMNLLPFKFFQEFDEIVSGRATDEMKNTSVKHLLRALNRLESPYSNTDYFEQWVIGQISGNRRYNIIQGPEFANSDFALQADSLSLPYIEVMPRRLHLCYLKNPSIKPLDVDLLLYELLRHTAEGFVSRQPYELLLSDIARFRQGVMGTFDGINFSINEPSSKNREQVEISNGILRYRR